ncbi:AsmA-like C-terminal region-containing protein [Portibacter marinus]|uniref:AsmA-like C-terminal region-containing protein n=1 Tax=Portibacter marinus TaxID=2898660 RepID=UPI001F35ABE1|nr:AsmA-like C-terminal region-containing protein [Portibacter marinus]
MSITLLIPLLFLTLILGVGDYLINRYLNSEGNTLINELLPINGTLSFEKVRIRPFRDIPNISLKVENIILSDSLINEHHHYPVIIKSLYLNASLPSLRKRYLKIKSLELEGVNVSVYDRVDGYSNLTSIIQSYLQKGTMAETMNDWTVSFDHSKLNIQDLEVIRIDDITEQQAQLSVQELAINSTEVDSSYQFDIDIEKFKTSSLHEKIKSDIPLQIEKVKADVLVKKYWTEARISSIQLDDGQLYLHTDENSETNFSDIVGLLKSSTNSNVENGMDIELHGASLTMSDINFLLIDQIRNRHVETKIVDLETEFNLTHDTTAVIELHLDVSQVSPNVNKGSFLKNSIVKGQVNTDYRNSSVALTSSTLKINQDTFEVQSFLSLDNRQPTTLTIEKDDARIEKVRPLLNDYLQARVSTYEARGPIQAKLNLVFTPGVKKARADLHMSVNNQTLVIQDEVFENAVASVTIINGLYDDYRQYSENIKNTRVQIHHVSGVTRDFHITSEDALITYTPEQGLHLKAKAEVSGNAAVGSQFLEHDRFIFRNGTFLLKSDIDAPLNNFETLFSGTDLDLKIRNIDVYNPAGNTSFPLNLMSLRKTGDSTTFAIEGLNLGVGSPIQIDGEVINLEAVLFPGKDEQLQTHASIRANSLNWQGLVAVFGKDGIISTTIEESDKLAKRSMKQTLSGMQKSFRPSVEVFIDTINYGREFQLYDFKTGLNFKNDKTLVLQETNFEIENSNVILDGEVVINQLDYTKFDFDIALNNLDFDVLMPKFDYFGVKVLRQIHDQPDNLTVKAKISGDLDDIEGLDPESIDAYITYESFSENKFTGSLSLQANPSTKNMDVVFSHSGLPKNINKLLGSEEYTFDKGWFTASFEFSDNYESFAQMLEESKSSLSIANAEVKIKSLGVTVPLSRIEVASINNNAYYNLLIRSDSLDHELTLDGVVKNVRHFAFNDTEEPYEIDLTLSSPELVWEHLKQVALYGDSNTPQSGRLFKKSVTKILQDFNPNVKLQIDKFLYTDQLSFNDIYAHAYMEDDILSIDSANVYYGNSHIEADIEMNMAFEYALPFKLNLDLTYIDISHTLRYFNYFNREELRNAKQIDGKVWLDLDMAGEIDLKNNVYDYAKTDANLRFVVQNLVVDDLETINAISRKIRREDRFRKLRFAPISTRVKVQGKRIEVEQTEIQSNAAQAFVEGTIDKSSPEDLWISIPIDNLKKPDLDTIPKQTGYEDSGLKIFLQWITSQSEDDGKVKFRLSKKKFFQERNESKEFKAYKRKNRKARRELRKSAESN